MDTDYKRISEAKLIELEIQLKEYHEKMKQLEKDKDVLEVSSMACSVIRLA